MKPVQVLALGTYHPQDLLVTVRDSNRTIDPTIEAQVDVLWEAIQAKAQEEGRVCYNGISYRLNALTRMGEKLAIEFGLLEYKAREALPQIPGYYDLPDSYYRKGCYSGATVRTSDGYYLVVELSGKSMNLNRVDVLGGIIEKPTEITNGASVFGSLYAELEEEGCIHGADIQECYLRMVYQEAKTNIGFYFEVQLQVPATTLLERFATEMQDPDITSLKALTKDEYQAMLRAGSPGKQLMAEHIAL